MNSRKIDEYEMTGAQKSHEYEMTGEALQDLEQVCLGKEAQMVDLIPISIQKERWNSDVNHHQKACRGR